MRLLFLHGAGGFAEDRNLAEELGAALGAVVDYPRLPDQDMSYAAWSAVVRAGLSRVEPDDVVVGHSLGASILLKVLTREQSPVHTVQLLAMPDWSRRGWDVPQYQCEAEGASARLSLHHCRDDEIVPFTHLALHTERLPSAQVHEHQVGGHQFHGVVEALATHIRMDN